MSHHKKCVVIKIGSHHTIAGFNNTELPQCILPSSYLKKGSDEYIFGTISMLEEAMAKNEGETNESLEVFTTVDENGIPYNWTVIEQQLKYIYKTQLKCEPQDLPLVITVPHLKSELANKVLERYFNIAFTKLNVPVLQIIIEPLAIALAMGKTSALVIDLGSSGCNITPIVEGTVVKTSVMRSRFAGDFLDYQVTQKVENIVKNNKKKNNSEEIDIDGDINISNEDNILSDNKDSVDVWLQANTWIQDFKINMLQVSDKELPELERFYKEQAEMQIRQQEQLQQYSTNNVNAKLDEAAIASIQNNNPLSQKKNFLYKLANQTISLESRQCYELAESLFNPSMISEKYTKEDGLGEIIGKSIKKAGASVSSVGTNTIGALGASMTIQPMNTQSKNNYLGDNNGNNNSNATGINSLSTTATTPEYIYSMLLTNIIVTGATSLINGMEQRIIKELSIRFPQYKITTFANQVTMDRKIQGWTSSVSMSNLPSWELAKWYTKSDYEKELNSETVNEK
ncbi:similar to Saccharomyces cerevisiae YPR034W ARP7 Component of both the SWI/SNF and RSC chromatin remodeling complexes [Maudiozyma saulgeensis]|uniref:Similar to Saccharomyces cerevisiae YPR034W ARP7 Component of both the SWI/SNF and RSC chromatin remodeling complexes n=1 Tax=Maudiozyma saulgeensis TaxID=1789683 RepID=A0A1X7QYG3_9SACH|nr:similar to Saccharomyces cerevisiae YPR034W ARP7 Component of both the SWI/SNF and RSC chromatin remodeling complexes [Kazachstania saulgeensis]